MPALQQVGDYLVEIKDKVAQMESSLQDDSARIQLSSELAALENELSTYLSMHPFKVLLKKILI